MPTRIILTLDEDLTPGETADDVKLVLVQALAAYRSAREPVKAYVMSRYDYMTDAERAQKAVDVQTRVDLAGKIRGASVEIERDLRYGHEPGHRHVGHCPGDLVSTSMSGECQPEFVRDPHCEACAKLPQ